MSKCIYEIKTPESMYAISPLKIISSVANFTPYLLS